MKKKIGIGIVVLIVIIGIAGAMTGNGETEPSNGETEPETDDIKIIEHELVREDEGTSYESVTVRGRAQNISGKELSSVYINVVYYDEDGVRLDDLFDHIADVPDQQVWTFDTGSTLMGEEAAKVVDYEISVEIKDW